MNKHPLVSILLPIYNGAKTLEQTLSSLLSQTFGDFEIIACIDGSKDGSEEILKKYKDDRITILRNQKNLGLGPTLNRIIAMTHPNSRYLAMAEQDDYYYPDRLALQVEFLNKNLETGMVSGIAEFYNGEKVVGLFPGLLVNENQYPEGIEMFLLNYKKQIKVVNSCMMFRKSVHIENGLYFTQHHPSISVDWTYILRFSLVSNIFGLNNVLVRLDRRSNRKSVTSDKAKQFTAARELIRSFKYEYPNIISKKDFKYAMTTQHILELSHLSKFWYIVYLPFYFFQNPQNRSWSQHFKKKFLK